jgi:AcrR family transcriptional regulator
MKKRRKYQSAVREQTKSEMRDRIVQAVIGVILHEGVHAFSMQNVADKAGIALRTVYRHFATREQLLEGLSDHLDDAMTKFGFRAPSNVAEFEAVVRPLYSSFARIQDAVRASVVASLATGYASRSHRERRSAVHDVVAGAYPNLSASDLKEAVAMIITLSGSRVWYVMTAELGLDADQGGRAAEWALRTLFRDLATRNKAAERSRKGGR